MIIDGAGRHTSEDPVVPGNITLAPLPPYSPELKAIEKLWRFMGQTLLSHRLFADLNAILDGCCDVWNRNLAEPGCIPSTCWRPWASQVTIQRLWHETANLLPLCSAFLAFGEEF